MRRAAVYAGTRNVYPAMAAAAKSLVEKTRMDRIYFLIEDEAFPEELPGVIQCLDVRGSAFFDANGPNYHTPWTYMTLMRLALHRILPGEGRVLWLDVDTIVMQDIGALFDVDLQGMCLAAVREPGRSKSPFVYFNAGVLLMDLEKMRGGIGDELVQTVNARKLDFADQDAINLRCQGLILELDPIYNACPWTQQPMNARIYHFAADRRYTEKKLFQQYMNMKWSEINACKE